MPYHQTTIYQDSFTAVYIFCRRSLYEFSKRETLEIPAVTVRSGKYRLDIYRMVVDATVTLSKKAASIPHWKQKWPSFSATPIMRLRFLLRQSVCIIDVVCHVIFLKSKTRHKSLSNVIFLYIMSYAKQED